MAENKREEILGFLRRYVEAQGYGPSVREICAGVGLSSTATVYYHLKQLAAQGRISLGEGKKRAISLPRDPVSQSVPAEDQASQAQSRAAELELLQPLEPPRGCVPLVGTVAAGQPILALEHIEGYIPWEGGEGWFALRVKGESMKNAGILPGDRVVVRPQPTAENGEIVVALLGDEATVKRFSRRRGHVWLLPENEAFAPIDGDEASILGVVRGVLRTYA